MKHLFIITFLLLNFLIVFAQGKKEFVLLQTNSKTDLYCIALSDSVGLMYQMSIYKEGTTATSWLRIKSTDTLTWQPGGFYVSANTRIVTENHIPYLIIQNKKTRKFKLDATSNIKKIYTILNKAYYLDSLYVMYIELRKIYPLYSYNFYDGFQTWEKLSGKDMDPGQFRLLANERLQRIKDSIVLIHNQYALFTGSLIQNLKTIGYNGLKDSLEKLQVTDRDEWWYYAAIIEEVIKQQPEYFFRLAEDFPEQRSRIFFIAKTKNNRKEIERLLAVKGHDNAKKEFAKTRSVPRSAETVGWIIAPVILVGAITLLVVLL